MTNIYVISECTVKSRKVRSSNHSSSPESFYSGGNGCTESRVPQEIMQNSRMSEMTQKAKLLAEAFWPGPITLVLKKKSIIPDLITGGKDTVAVRIPNHPLTLDLLSKLVFPLAAPSANPFNRISPTKAEHVESYFKDKIKMVLSAPPGITVSFTKSLKPSANGCNNPKAPITLGPRRRCIAPKIFLSANVK